MKQLTALFLLLLCPLMTTEHWGQEVYPTENRQNKEEFNQLFSADINALTEGLIKKEYAESLDVLGKLMEKIKLQQEDIVQGFFPDTYKKFKKKQRQPTLPETDFAQSGYGVFFTQLYTNKRGDSIEINIVFSDESIKDYQDLIQNPHLVEGMEGTEIIQNNQYKALMTVSEENKHYEENIILRDDLMMTVVAVGIKQASIIHDFVAQIDLKSLEQYLEK